MKHANGFFLVLTLLATSACEVKVDLDASNIAGKAQDSAGYESLPAPAATLSDLFGEWQSDCVGGVKQTLNYDGVRLQTKVISYYDSACKVQRLILTTVSHSYLMESTRDGAMSYLHVSNTIFDLNAVATPAATDNSGVAICGHNYTESSAFSLMGDCYGLQLEEGIFDEFEIDLQGNTLTIGSANAFAGIERPGVPSDQITLKRVTGL